MAELTVVVPSRGRPQAASDMLAAFADTCEADTAVVLAVGVDDPDLDGYEYLVRLDVGLPVELYRVKPVDRPSTMVHALNDAAVDVAGRRGVQAIGFMGDDHRPRALGWDATFLATLRGAGTGMVYGDDLYQGEALPTQIVMTADIVRALGWMAPPDLWHMFCDDWWRELGHAAGCLIYLPRVVVEHLHPLAGKARWDDSYRASNSQAVYRHDYELYARARADLLPTAAALVRQARAQGWLDTESPSALASTIGDG